MWKNYTYETGDHDGKPLENNFEKVVNFNQTGSHAHTPTIVVAQYSPPIQYFLYLTSFPIQGAEGGAVGADMQAQVGISQPSVC